MLCITIFVFFLLSILSSAVVLHVPSAEKSERWQIPVIVIDFTSQESNNVGVCYATTRLDSRQLETMERSRVLDHESRKVSILGSDAFERYLHTSDIFRESPAARLLAALPTPHRVSSTYVAPDSSANPYPSRVEAYPLTCGEEATFYLTSAGFTSDDAIPPYPLYEAQKIAESGTDNVADHSIYRLQQAKAESHCSSNEFDLEMSRQLEDQATIETLRAAGCIQKSGVSDLKITFTDDTQMSALAGTNIQSLWFRPGQFMEVVYSSVYDGYVIGVLHPFPERHDSGSLEWHDDSSYDTLTQTREFVDRRARERQYSYLALGFFSCGTKKFQFVKRYHNNRYQYEQDDYQSCDKPGQCYELIGSDNSIISTPYFFSSDVTNNNCFDESDFQLPTRYVESVPLPQTPGLNIDPDSFGIQGLISTNPLYYVIWLFIVGILYLSVNVLSSNTPNSDDKEVKRVSGVVTFFLLFFVCPLSSTIISLVIVLGGYNLINLVTTTLILISGYFVAITSFLYLLSMVGSPAAVALPLTGTIACYFFAMQGLVLLALNHKFITNGAISTFASNSSVTLNYAVFILPIQLLLLGAYVFFGYVTRPPLASFKPSSVSEKYDDQSTVLKEKETKTVETEGEIVTEKVDEGERSVATNSLFGNIIFGGLKQKSNRTLSQTFSQFTRSHVFLQAAFMTMVLVTASILLWLNNFIFNEVLNVSNGVYWWLVLMNILSLGGTYFSAAAKSEFNTPRVRAIYETTMLPTLIFIVTFVWAVVVNFGSFDNRLWRGDADVLIYMCSLGYAIIIAPITFLLRTQSTSCQAISAFTLASLTVKILHELTDILNIYEWDPLLQIVVYTFYLCAISMSLFIGISPRFSSIALPPGWLQDQMQGFFTSSGLNGARVRSASRYSKNESSNK